MLYVVGKPDATLSEVSDLLRHKKSGSAVASQSSQTRPRATNLVKHAGRGRGVVAFESAVVAFFVNAAEILAVPRSVAAIYGVCLANAEPLSFADIGERLDISNGSISQGLRVLKESGALVVRSNPLERCERFEPELKLRKLAVGFIDHRLKAHLRIGRSGLAAIADAVPNAPPEAAKVLRSRIKSLQTWHEKTQALLPLIQGFLKHT